MTPITSPACPCGSGKLFENCCAPFLRGERPAPGAESLMRSRYCAYVMEDEAYLLATWHPRTRPTSLDLTREPRPKWLGLAVKSKAVLDADHARVEFVARYRVAGRGVRLHERSRFVKQQGRWLYVDGDLQ